MAVVLVVDNDDEEGDVDDGDDEPLDFLGIARGGTTGPDGAVGRTDVTGFGRKAVLGSRALFMLPAAVPRKRKFNNE